MPLTQEQQIAVKKGTPIQWNGLTLFPIQVKDMDLFLAAQIGLTASQQTLPGKYVVMRYLEALYALDYDVRTSGGKGAGLFNFVLLFLKLALRLEVIKGPNGEEYLPIQYRTERDNPRKLVALEVMQGESRVQITPQDFNQLREILAAQNGVELPDETLNPELVQAEKDLASKNTLNLKVDSESLIYSVSVKTHVPLEEIMEWTIRRFKLTERAVDRSTGHLVAALTEASGAKYKNGNPYPSWKYDRENDSSGVVELSGLINRLSGAVEAK